MTTFRLQASSLDDLTFATPSYDQSGLTPTPTGNLYDFFDFVNYPNVGAQTLDPHYIYWRVNVTVDGETSDWSNTYAQLWQIPS